MPRQPSDLSNVPGLTPGLQRRYGRRLLEVVERGSKAPPVHPPRHTRTPDAIISRYERLRQWRKRVGEKRGLASDIILPRDVLWNIAHKAPSNRQELRQVFLPLEWRFQKYAGEILTLLES